MTSCCETTGDGLQASHDPTRFAGTSAGWLIGQAVKYMHADDDEGRQSYQRATELLAHDSGGTESAARLLKGVQHGDPMLRWSLLYVLADAAPTGVGNLLTDVAVSALPAVNRDSQACESPRDLELLVRTMAIEGLAQVADRNGAELTQRQLVSVLERQMEPALRIEAVKALLRIAPASADLIRKILPEELHFAIDLRKAHESDLHVEPKFDTPITCEVAAAPVFGQKARSRSPSCSCHSEYRP
jgi:hypothetical protein